MTMQTLEELQHSIGGRPKFKLRRKKVRLSFYLDIREAQRLKDMQNLMIRRLAKLFVSC